MSKLRFDNRVVIVTGAGQGLGTAYARLLAELGASVVVNDLGDSAHKVAEEIVKAGGKAVGVAASVTDEADAKRVVDAALSKWGRVDGLINNAGLGFEQPFAESKLADLRKVIEVSLFGTMVMCQAVYPHMMKARYGRIVNVTSASIFGLPGWAAYAGSKAAVLSFSRTIALEWKDTGIKVNILAPAALTPMLTQFITDPGILASVQGAHPELVAPVAAYLAHEDADFTARAYFSGSGHTSMIQLGTTEGCAARPLTIDQVKEQIASGAMTAGFTPYGSALEQTVEQT